MDGDIKCTSEENKGTIISFYFTVKCSKIDKGLRYDDHEKFHNTLNDKIKKSQILIYNLYIDEEDQSPKNKKQKNKEFKQ